MFICVQSIPGCLRGAISCDTMYVALFGIAEWNNK